VPWPSIRSGMRSSRRRQAKRINSHWLH